MKNLIAILALVVALPVAAQQTAWPWNQNRALLDPNWHCMDPKVVGRDRACFPLKTRNNPWTVTKKFSHHNPYSAWYDQFRTAQLGLSSLRHHYSQPEMHVLFQFNDGGRLFVRVQRLPWDALLTGSENDDEATWHSGGGCFTQCNEPADHGTVDPRVIISVGRYAGVIRYWIQPHGFVWRNEYERTTHGLQRIGRVRANPCHPEYLGCWTTWPQYLDLEFLSYSDTEQKIWRWREGHPSVAMPLEELPAAMLKLRQCFNKPDNLAAFGAYTDTHPVNALGEHDLNHNTYGTVVGCRLSG